MLDSIYKIRRCKAGVVLIISTLICFQGITQINDIDFVIRNIRKNYFSLGLKYDSLKFEKYIRLKSKHGVSDTFRFISDLTNYFNDQHLICYQKKSFFLTDSNLGNLTQTGIREKILTDKRSKDKYAGFWINDLGSEIIGIVKQENMYYGYVYNSDDTTRIGKLILKISGSSAKKNYCEFVNSYFQYRLYVPIVFLNYDEFKIWSYTKYRRVTDNSSKLNEPLRSYSYTASVQLMDSGIVVFKIPENSMENIPVVDSLVIAYKSSLEKARILIIDIRNNPGGSIRTYSKLLPYVYTNEIVRPDGYYFVSNEYVEYELRNLSSIDSVKYKADYDNQLKYIDSLKKIIGRKVFYKGRSKMFDAVLSKPEKVAILVNYACMSAAEAMVLDMKQSKKVLIFGENTAGAIDNLNTFSIRLPSGKYSMWMPTFRAVPSPVHKHYSGKGIPPDVKIGSKVDDWVQYTIKYFETH